MSRDVLCGLQAAPAVIVIGISPNRGQGDAVHLALGFKRRKRSISLEGSLHQRIPFARPEFVKYLISEYFANLEFDGKREKLVTLVGLHISNNK
jgi:hypothetical protein